MQAILQLVLLILLILISLALVIGVSLGIGWVLKLILPFSLFEGTVVGMVAAFVTWTIWHRVFGLLSPFAGEDDEDDEEEEEEGEIPESRFWKDRTEKTWENWFRYVFANTIYEELADSWDGSEDTNERTLQEQAIRLADAAVEGLKGKSPFTKRLRISPDTLKHELARMGQLPYHHKILVTAADAANAEVD